MKKNLDLTADLQGKSEMGAPEKEMGYLEK